MTGIYLLKAGQFLREKLACEKGMTLTVLLVVLFPIAVLFLALLLEYSTAFMIRHEIQAACDAAALAGASQAYITEVDGELKAVIDTEIADIEANNILDKNLSEKKIIENGVKIVKRELCPVDESRYGVYIVADVPTIFARIGTGGKLAAIRIERYAEGEPVPEQEGG